MNIIVVRNAICRHTAIMVCISINHFAILPNGSVTEVYNSFACIIAGFTAIAKQTRAGYCIYFYPVYNILSRNIDGILIISHVTVIDVHHWFLSKRPTVIDCTTVEIYCDVMRSCTIIGVDIDNFSIGIKRAVIESHHGRTVCPDGVISAPTSSFWAVECGVAECCRSIAPVESLAVDHAVFNDCFVGSSKTEIIITCSLKRHVLKCYSFLFFLSTATVETVVAVIFRAEILRVRYLRTDAPLGIFRPRANEGQVFVLSILCIIWVSLGAAAAHFVQGIETLGQLNGIATFCSLHRLANAPIRLLCGCTDSLLPIITIYRIHVDCCATNSLLCLISFVSGCTDSILRIITIYRIHVVCCATNSLLCLISFVSGCTDSILRIITIYRIHVVCCATNSLLRKYAWCD